MISTPRNTLVINSLGGLLTRAVLALLLLILVGMFVAPTNVSAAQVSCGAMLTADTTLDSDLNCTSGNGLVIAADGITIDCQGYTITGPSSPFPAFTGRGIFTTSGTNSVTIKNCHVEGFARGFELNDSNGNTLQGNTAKDNGFQGFVFIGSSENIIIDNTASDNTLQGFYFSSSSNNIITMNTAEDNKKKGFIFIASSGNIITTNVARENIEEAFLLWNMTDSVLSNNIATDNAASGFHLYANSNRNTFTDNTSEDNGGDGFLVGGNSRDDVFTVNYSRDNRGSGYFDDTSGTGTAGTANTYISNECEDNFLGESTPLGLCSAQP